MQTTPIQSAMRAACPKCGKGALYSGKLSLEPAKHCNHCGLDYGFIDTGDGPAVLLSFLFGFATLGLALIVEYLFSPPLWVHAIVWTVVLLGVSISTLRITKALLIALQYQKRISNNSDTEQSDGK